MEKYAGLKFARCRRDSSMPFFKKNFRPAGTGVGRSPAKESQSLKPEFQSRCSVVAPMPWMCINVLVSMIDTISGFGLNLNCQLINPFPPCKPSHCIRERLTLYVIKIVIIDHSLFFAMMFMQQKGKEGALQPALVKVFGFVIRTRLILTQC